MSESNFFPLVLGLAALFSFVSCSDDDTSDTPDSTDETTVDISILAGKFYNTEAMTVTVGGTLPLEMSRLTEDIRRLKAEQKQAENT